MRNLFISFVNPFAQESDRHIKKFSILSKIGFVGFSRVIIDFVVEAPDDVGVITFLSSVLIYKSDPNTKKDVYSHICTVPTMTVQKLEVPSSKNCDY